MKYFFTQKELNMRQRRWLELVTDYDYVINYHPGKENEVADIPSRRMSANVAALSVTPKPLMLKQHKLELEIVFKGHVARLMTMSLQHTLLEKIKQR